MSQKKQLLKLLGLLKKLSEDEHQAIAVADFVRLEGVQDEKNRVHKQIKQIEPIPLDQMSCHADDPAVRQVVAEILSINRESSHNLSQRMNEMKVEAENQVQTGVTLRRVQGAYGRQSEPARWIAYT